MRRWSRATVFAVAAFLRMMPAHAAGSGDIASAEALFDEGRKLMQSGQYSEACAKFESSQKLDPGVGTMLNLADCYEKVGKTATAWAEFREAISAAHTAGSADRATIAQQRAAALEPKLSYVTIVGWKGQTVVVTRDGTPVDAAMVGAAIPVDPGRHVIEASAPGKRTWSTSVDVGANGDRVSVSVPILPDEAGAAPVPVSPPPPSTEPASSAEQHPGSTQRTVAIVAGSVGVAGVVVGTIFGIRASSKWSDAKSHCDPYPYCGASGVDAANSARSSANIATVAFIVGAAGIAGGAVLWFTAPRATEGPVALGIGPGNLLVRGRF
ncbi:MAG TPA: hypothetical protein VH142_23165 [Polyangiaceae bacterium]|nr:hypothetical protein [Polyangiaceae bacterium]